MLQLRMICSPWTRTAQECRCLALTSCSIHQLCAAPPHLAFRLEDMGVGAQRWTGCTTELLQVVEFRGSCAGNTRLGDRPHQFGGWKKWKRNDVRRLLLEDSDLGFSLWTMIVIVLCWRLAVVSRHGLLPVAAGGLQMYYHEQAAQSNMYVSMTDMPRSWTCPWI